MLAVFCAEGYVSTVHEGEGAELPSAFLQEEGLPNRKPYGIVGRTVPLLARLCLITRMQLRFCEMCALSSSHHFYVQSADFCSSQSPLASLVLPQRVRDFQASMRDVYLF